MPRLGAGHNKQYNSQLTVLQSTRIRDHSVIRTDTYRSATYDFLLTFHGNNVGLFRTVSEISGDFCQKSQIFPPQCILHPADRVPFEIEYRRRGLKKTRMMGLQDGLNVLR